jgi:hypothetical protein
MLYIDSSPCSPLRSWKNPPDMSGLNTQVVGGSATDSLITTEFLNFVSKYEIIKVARLTPLKMTRVEYAVTVLKYDYPGSTSTYIVEYSYRVSLEKQNDGFFKIQKYRIT